MHALFEGTGVRPTWIVGAGETAAYRAAGASDVRVGGGLCESRNMAIDIASAADKGKGRLCVQLSDDLSTVHFCESRKECSMSLAEWRRPNQEDANRLAREATEHALTPVGGAQLLEVGMRAPKLKLAGGYCTANRGFALRQVNEAMPHPTADRAPPLPFICIAIGITTHPARLLTFTHPPFGPSISRT